MKTKSTLRRRVWRLVPSLAAACFLLAGGTARAETLRGTFNYHDSADLQLHPIIDAKVEVWRYAPGFLGIWGWGKASTVYTDDSGSINTQLALVASGEVIALRVFATNHAAVVWPESTVHTTPFYREPGEPDGQPIHRTARSNSDVLSFSYDFAETWSAQHYNIAEALRRAAVYANANLPKHLPLVNAQPTTITSNNSSFYNPVNDTVTINTVSSFDDYVMIHEYGHFIEEQIGSLPWTPSTHTLCMYTDSGLAWMEGFSDYFGMAVRRTPLGNGLVGSFFDYDIEPGTACSSGDPHDRIEYFIAAALYDLADASIDRNSTAETHDFVQGMDSVILAIVDQMDAFGSVPTIWSFRNAWIGRGLNRNDLDRILVKHGMLAPFRDSAFASQSMPSTLVAGQTGSAAVTFWNTGSTTWTQADLYRLGSQSPQDNWIWGLNRVALPVPTVYPGQQVTFSVTLTAPATPGRYSFVWQMVQDGVTWFGPKTPEGQTISVAAGVQ